MLEELYENPTGYLIFLTIWCGLCGFARGLAAINGNDHDKVNVAKAIVFGIVTGIMTAVMIDLRNPPSTSIKFFVTSAGAILGYDIIVSIVMFGRKRLRRKVEDG